MIDFFLRMGFLFFPALQKLLKHLRSKLQYFAQCLITVGRKNRGAKRGTLMCLCVQLSQYHDRSLFLSRRLEERQKTRWNHRTGLVQADSREIHDRPHTYQLGGCPFIFVNNSKAFTRGAGYRGMSAEPRLCAVRG